MTPSGPAGHLDTALVCVWDTSALLHAGRAERLDVLGDLVQGPGNGWAHHVPAAIVEELAAYDVRRPEWTQQVHVDHLDELIALGAWTQRLASGPHHRGEATVVAWAESHRATACRRLAKTDPGAARES